MKIQCNACEVAEASVVCCADEAALCRACDEKVHAANKLASKHQRVPLFNSSSSHMPKCDICQETVGYFFCLEDRALLCGRCDVAIHTANAYVSSHQRFLLTGVKVGLEPTEPVVFSSKDKSNSTQKKKDMPSRSLSKKGSPMSLSGDNNEVRSSQAGGSGGLPIKVSFSGAMPGIIPELPLEETLGLTDFSQNYGFFEVGSSKTDCSKLEDTEWSPIHHAAAAGEVDLDECLSQVPEIPRGVSEIPSPPTASGLHWPRSFQDSYFVDNSMSVPDLCSKLQDTEWSPIHHAAAAGEVDLDECLSQVPEIPRGVSEIPSPPTASGLHWPSSFQDSYFVDNSMSVPDLCSLPSQHRNQSLSFEQ